MSNRRLISKGVYKILTDPLKKLTDGFEGREKDVVLLSSIGVLSNCLPNVFGMYDKDVVYPHLYVIIIAPAASGKGVMNFSRILTEKIHRDIYIQSSMEHERCVEENKQREKSKDKEPPEKCPEIEIKILPANVSSAEMYYYLGTSKHGLIIVESEADTMSNILKNDWGNYSDVLRKAFHNEHVSISRKTGHTLTDMAAPKLAMVLSGTPEQLKPLIQSRENGLFSRLLIYSFDEIADFKDVFAKDTKHTKELFVDVGKKVSELYNELVNMKSSIEFMLTDIQKQKFIHRFRYIRENVISSHSESFLSNVYRHGLIMFRICMILTVLRHKENLKDRKTLICNDTDFFIALSIMQTALRHSQYTFDTIETCFLSSKEETILDELNKKFTREDAINAGIKHGVPKRTVDDKLSQWQKKKIIKKESKGIYNKL